MSDVVKKVIKNEPKSNNMKKKIKITVKQINKINCEKIYRKQWDESYVCIIAKFYILFLEIILSFYLYK